MDLIRLPACKRSVAVWGQTRAQQACRGGHCGQWPVHVAGCACVHAATHFQIFSKNLNPSGDSVQQLLQLQQLLMRQLSAAAAAVAAAQKKLKKTNTTVSYPTTNWVLEEAMAGNNCVQIAKGNAERIAIHLQNNVSPPTPQSYYYRSEVTRTTHSDNLRMFAFILVLRV